MHEDVELSKKYVKSWTRLEKDIEYVVLDIPKNVIKYERREENSPRNNPNLLLYRINGKGYKEKVNNRLDWRIEVIKRP